MKRFAFCLSLLGLWLAAPVARADGICEPAGTYCLAAFGFNFNGTIQAVNWPDSLPAAPAGWAANYSGFDLTTGLGSINFTFTGGAGNYNFLAFFDHDIGPWPLDSNSGSAFGTLAAGQTWQLGDPGYSSEGSTYAGFASNTLINGNQIESGEYGDVSAALGWSFYLNQGDVAYITLMSSTTAPASGFYLQEFDAVTGSTVDLSGKVTITPSETAVPEPGSVGLLATGLVVLIGAIRRCCSM